MGYTQKLGLLAQSVFQDSSLNIGIGGSPSGSYKLEVTGTGKFTGAITGGSTITATGNIRSTNAGATVYTELQTDGIYATGANLYLYAPSTKDISLYAGDVQRMRITSAGNVGIGSSTANNKLSIVDSSYDNYSLRLESNSGNTANRFGGIGFAGEVNNTKAAILFVSNGSSYSRGSIVFSNNDESNQNNATLANERMRITSGGNVLIGTTTDDYSRLIVQGTVTDSGTNTIFCKDSAGTGLFYVRCDGYINTGSKSVSPYNLVKSGRVVIVDSIGGLGYQSSTRESKTNINNLSNVSFLYQLNPVSFNYRKTLGESNTFTDEFNQDLHYGLIADEVEKINKELVFYNEKDGVKELAGVEYGKLTAVLVKAIQELNERLNKAGL